MAVEKLSNERSKNEEKELVPATNPKAKVLKIDFDQINKHLAEKLKSMDIEVLEIIIDEGFDPTNERIAEVIGSISAEGVKARLEKIRQKLGVNTKPKMARRLLELHQIRT